MTVVGETTIIGEDGTNSGGRSEEARVLIEYVFSAALASEAGNPAGFRQAMESAEAEGKKSTVEEIKKAIAKRLSIKDEGRLSKHLVGVGYDWNADGSLTKHQKDYIAEIIITYEKSMKHIDTKWHHVRDMIKDETW